MDYDTACRTAAKRQMPSVPGALFDGLPVDGNPTGTLYIAQTGGFCMVLSCDTRGLTEEDRTFYVNDSREGMEGVTYYEGPSLPDAIAALIA